MGRVDIITGGYRRVEYGTAEYGKVEYGMVEYGAVEYGTVGGVLDGGRDMGRPTS